VDDQGGVFNVYPFGYAFVEDEGVCSAFYEAGNSFLHVFYALYWSDAYAMVNWNHDGSVVRLEYAV
jgi:hypothetical protein